MSNPRNIVMLLVIIYLSWAGSLLMHTSGQKVQRSLFRTNCAFPLKQSKHLTHFNIDTYFVKLTCNF